MKEVSQNPTQKTIFAIAYYDQSKIALNYKKSETFKCNVLMLPFIKYDPEKHGKYDEEKMKELVVSEFFKEKDKEFHFDPEKIVYFKSFSLEKIQFRIAFIKIGSIGQEPAKENKLFYKRLHEVRKNYNMVPVHGTGNVMVLPSLVVVANQVSELAKAFHC